METKSPPVPAFAVIGDPIEHSMSPLLHGAVFAAVGVEARFDVVRVRPDSLAAFISRVRQTGEPAGLNVTIPHKERILPLLDEVLGDAALSGAVNVVTVGKDPNPEGRRLTGHNTDMEGLLLAVRRCGFDYNGSRIAVSGTGGAALGAICKAATYGAKEVSVFGRNREKAEAALARAAALDREPGTETAFSFRGAPEAEKLEGVDIFINATPLGMAGYPEDFADTSFLRGLPAGALVYDMVYTPSLTALVRAARERGLRAENGLGMLVLQGLLADALFFGVPKEEWLTDGNFKTGYETLARELRVRERKMHGKR